MSGHEYDYLLKILLVGDSGVGKSSVLQRFAEDRFVDTSRPTIGVDFKMKTINVSSKVVKLQVWDTSGQERFRTITNAYFRGCDGVLIVYDVTNLRSFERVQHWIDETDRYCNSNVSKMIVGCKTDLADRSVPYDQVRKFAETVNVEFREVSSKDGSTVEEAFLALSSICLESLQPDLFPCTILTLQSCAACSAESRDSVRVSFTKLSGESIEITVSAKASVKALAVELQKAHGFKRVRLLTMMGSPLRSEDLLPSKTTVGDDPKQSNIASKAAGTFAHAFLSAAIRASSEEELSNFMERLSPADVERLRVAIAATEKA